MIVNLSRMRGYSLTMTVVQSVHDHVMRMPAKDRKKVME